MFAVAVAGWQLLRQLRSFESALPPGKQASVRFFLDRIVPEASGLRASATAGAARALCGVRPRPRRLIAHSRA